MFRAIGLFLAVQVVFITLIFAADLSPKTVAGWSVLATFCLFLFYRSRQIQPAPADVVRAGVSPRWADDHLWAGLLTSLSVGVLYYFA